MYWYKFYFYTPFEFKILFYRPMISVIFLPAITSGLVEINPHSSESLQPKIATANVQRAEVSGNAAPYIFGAISQILSFCLYPWYMFPWSSEYTSNQDRVLLVIFRVLIQLLQTDIQMLHGQNELYLYLVRSG